MKKTYDKKVNQHYDKVANKQKKSKFSTMADEYIRNQETDFIINIIKNDKKKLNIFYILESFTFFIIRDIFFNYFI